MSIDGFNRAPDQEYYAQREGVIRQAGTLLADRLSSQPDPTLLLDMDGVVFRADGLRYPRLTTLALIPALQFLENQGVKIGPATGRGINVVQTLRDYGLQIQGPGIFEEGQTFVTNGEVQQLGHPNHLAFMNTMRQVMAEHPEFVPTWDHVKPHNDSGIFAFSPGNFQWQGRNRSSYWFHYDGDPKRDNEIVQSVIKPIVQDSARQHGLNPDRDVAVGVYRMKPSKLNGNLAIVGVKGTHNGKVIHKGTAAERLEGTWGFAADGFGDTPLAMVTKARDGVVIGIEGNLDLTNDAPEFLKTSDAVLRDPQEFAAALRHTAKILQARNR